MIFEARSAVAAVDEINLAGETREEQRLLGRAVAAADDRDIHLAVERAVAGRAGRHALAAVKLLFAGDAGQARRGAGGDDDGLRPDLAVGELQRVGPLEVSRPCTEPLS
jgi:hypothetical protein